MKSMKNVTNAAIVNVNVTEDMTSKKTKTLTKLYIQVEVSIKDALPMKKTYAKKQGNLGK